MIGSQLGASVVCSVCWMQKRLPWHGANRNGFQELSGAVAELCRVTNCSRLSLQQLNMQRNTFIMTDAMCFA